MRAADLPKLAELVEPFRSRLAGLLEAAGGAVWIGSGRRSIQQQVDLRRAHCGPTWYDIWQRPASQCSPPTAIPGRSKHNTGQAADLEGNLGLAERLARSSGLHTPVAGEAWHFEVDPSVGGPLGIQVPDIPGAAHDVIEGAGGVLGDGINGVGDAVADAVLGVVEDITEPLFEWLRRITLVGLLVAGGVTLVVLGGLRSVQSRGEAMNP